jgi:thiol-disulfide isomerase/thioredoxin
MNWISVRKIFLTLLLVLTLTPIVGQEIRSIDKEHLQEILSRHNDTTYVINFWATWCSPCVAEIAYFEALHRTYADSLLKVILVNLDFPSQVERRVVPFMKEKELTSEVLNMTTMDYNSWIPDVDGSWSGAIPATLIFRDGYRSFTGRELSREELFEMVQTAINL